MRNLRKVQCYRETWENCNFIKKFETVTKLLRSSTQSQFFRKSKKHKFIKLLESITQLQRKELQRYRGTRQNHQIIKELVWNTKLLKHWEDQKVIEEIGKNTKYQKTRENHKVIKKLERITWRIWGNHNATRKLWRLHFYNFCSFHYFFLKTVERCKKFTNWFGEAFIVMGSIDENRYRYSIDTLAKVSILRYLSKNPHCEHHIHKLVTYFDVFQLADFEFFEIFVFLTFAPFYSVSGYFIVDFFFWHFLSLFQ